MTDAGVLMQLEGGVGVRVELKNEKDVALLKDFVAVRDALFFSRSCRRRLPTRRGCERSVASLLPLTGSSRIG